MTGESVHRPMLLIAVLLLVMPLAQAVTEAVPMVQLVTAAPTTTEVERYTRPMVRARLRIPDSLQGFVVATVAPMTSDVSRFEVEVRFRARTPFGAITEHSARFRMKPASRRGEWIVTAE